MMLKECERGLPVQLSQTMRGRGGEGLSNSLWNFIYPFGKVQRAPGTVLRPSWTTQTGSQNTVLLRAAGTWYRFKFIYPLFDHLFFISSLIHWFIYVIYIIYSFIRLFICSFIHWVISFIHLFNFPYLGSWKC